MADLGGMFDARSVDPSESYKPIPAGRYKCVLRKSNWKTTKAGTGQYLEMTFEVVDGDRKGRRLVGRLNLKNPNQVAVEIARGELSAICHATGVLQPTDTAQLENIPLAINVKVVERNDKKGEYSNEIDSYESIGSSASPPSPSPAMATSDTDKAPWE